MENLNSVWLHPIILVAGALRERWHADGADRHIDADTVRMVFHLRGDSDRGGSITKDPRRG